MSEVTDWDEKEDDQGPLGPIGKSVARRRRKLDSERVEYDRLLVKTKLDKAIITDEDLERHQRDLNRLLELEESLRVSGRDPYADAAAEHEFANDDPLPAWLRSRLETPAAAGGAAVGAIVQGLKSIEPEAA